MVSSMMSSRSGEGFRRPSDREDIVYLSRGQLGLHSPAPIPLVTPMDRYARSWMSFLQTLVSNSERTAHAPSLMLQLAGRDYAELLRKPNMRTSVGPHSDG